MVGQRRVQQRIDRVAPGMVDLEKPERFANLVRRKQRHANVMGSNGRAGEFVSVSHFELEPRVQLPEVVQERQYGQAGSRRGREAVRT